MPPACWPTRCSGSTTSRPTRRPTRWPRRCRRCSHAGSSRGARAPRRRRVAPPRRQIDKTRSRYAGALVPAPFDLPFVQRAVVEIALLAVGSGILGTWIVLRGLSFYAHAVGTAAFPGLVLADGLGFSPLLGALSTAGLVAIAVTALARRGRAGGARPPPAGSPSG